MNRREFLVLRADRALELNCERLYMRYVDSQVDGTTAQLFENLGTSLSAVSVLHLTDSAWLNCDELKPVALLIDAFRSRGGHVTGPKPRGVH